MTPLFADTVFFVGLLNPRDQYARQAQQFVASYTGQYVTTAAVLVEMANLLSRSPWRSQVGKFWKDLHAARSMHIVHPMPEDWERAVDLYTRRVDKEWSLVDCLSMIVMQEQELTRVLTADHHFEQAGFEILLK